MPSYVTPKKNTQFIFFLSLVSQANTKIMQANPTLAAADFNVSGDGGALGALGTTPTVTPASSKMVKVTLSAAEMNFDNVTLVCSDSAGAEWCDLVVNIQTSARQVDDLAFPATSGRSMVVDAAGLVDANTVKLGPTGAGTAQTAKDVGGAVPAAAAGASGGLLISGSNAGTTTLGALTITGVTTHTGNVVLSDGLTISAPSTLNRAGLDVTGNGTGAGIKITGGNGATGDAITATAASTNGNGMALTATGTGNALKAASVSGDAILTSVSTSGHGITAAGTGTTKHGINATGGATSSDGIRATGGGVGHGVNAISGSGATGDGIRAAAASTNGNGLTAAKTGSGNDLNATSTPLVLAKTTNLTGLNDIAATAIVSAGAITTSGGKVSGVILTDTLTTYTGNTPQTGDSFARLGAPAGASVSADVAALQADLPQRVTKNVALAAFPFFMYDSTDHVSGKTGLTITATRSIDGGAFAACANGAVEVGNGWYKIDLAASDLNGTTIALKFTATGADQQNVTVVTEPT